MRWQTVLVTLLFPLAAAAAPARSHKPEAPVAVALSARDLGGGHYEVTLRAVPTSAAAAVDLALVLPKGVAAESPIRLAFGATQAGQARTLVARVRRAGTASVRIAAGAGVRGRSGRRSRAAVVWLGKAPQVAPPPTRTVILPGGVAVAEPVK